MMTKFLIQFVVGIPLSYCVIVGIEKEFKVPLVYSIPIAGVLLTMNNLAVLNTQND